MARRSFPRLPASFSLGIRKGPEGKQCGGERSWKKLAWQTTFWGGEAGIRQPCLHGFVDTSNDALRSPTFDTAYIVRPALGLDSTQPSSPFCLYPMMSSSYQPESQTQTRACLPDPRYQSLGDRQHTNKLLIDPLRDQ